MFILQRELYQLPGENPDILDAAIVCQISIKRKRFNLLLCIGVLAKQLASLTCFLTDYNSLWKIFKLKKPDCIIIPGDFNCRTQQWWSGDIEDPHGTALDDLIQSKNLYQLIDKPTHIINDSSSCTDLIITSQPFQFLFVEHGVHPSLFKNCHLEIVHGKLNLLVPSPPAYERKLWDYNNADIDTLHDKVVWIGMKCSLVWMST